MTKHLARACLLVLVMALGASADDTPAEAKKDSPFPEPRPYYTAFPDLKPRPRDEKADLLSPALAELPADAPILRKVRREQAREGLKCLARLSKIIDLGVWSSQYLYDTVLMADAVYVVAAEVEEKRADRVPWYEERVRKLKELERFLELRVTPSPLHLNFVRFHRLGAEVDLLRLKDEVARTSGGAGRPLVFKKSEAAVLDVKELAALARGEQMWFTAFPDLKPRTSERKTVTKPDGTTEVVFEEKNVVPLPRLPVLPEDAPPLRKVLHEQVLTGFGYLRASAPVLPPLLDGALYAWQFLHYFRTTADTYRAAAELENRAADRVPWYEARVRWLKLAESIMTVRVMNGTNPPHDLEMARFYRLGTEADLLRRRAAVEKAGPTTGPAPVREATAVQEEWGFTPEKPRPYFTAFPDLEPRTVETIKTKGPDGEIRTTQRDKDVVPLPPLPVGADDPLAHKARLEQVREGFAYLDYVREVVLNGAWNSTYSAEYFHLTTEVFRAAAASEDLPAKRISWYEARVRALKDVEHFIDVRVRNGSDPRGQLFDIRMMRLRAEAELLAFKAAAEAPALAPPVVFCLPCPPVCCPPAGARPRGGLLPRLFHRR